MKKLIAMLTVLTMILAFAACGGSSAGLYDKAGKDAKKWAQDFDPANSSLKIYTETVAGAKEPVAVTDAVMLAEIKDAMDLIEVGAKTDADESMDRYILTFSAADGTKTNFSFRADGALLCDGQVYETVNAGSLFVVCGLTQPGENPAPAEQSDAVPAENAAPAAEDTAPAPAEPDPAAEDPDGETAYINQQIYDMCRNYILELTGNMSSEDLAGLSHALIDDFDEDGYVEAALAYSLDNQTIRAAVIRMDTATNEVKYQDAEIAQMVGAAKVKVCLGTFGGETCFVIWYDDYDSGAMGDYFVIPMSNGDLDMGSHIQYKVSEDGASGTFTQDGREVTQEAFNDFLTQIEFGLAGFGDNGEGVPFNEF